MVPTDHANQEDSEVIFNRSWNRGCIHANNVAFTISGVTNSMRVSNARTGSEKNSEMKDEGFTSSRVVSNNRTRHKI